MPFPEVPVLTRDRAPPVVLPLGEDAGVRAIDTHLAVLRPVSPLLPASPSSRTEPRLEEQL